MASHTIKAALVDLNGTLHIGNQAIPNSIEALKRLRDAGILVCPYPPCTLHSSTTHLNPPLFQVRFVSNTSKDTTTALVTQVQALGFDIQPNHVFTSIGAARALVAHRQLRPYLLLQPQAAAEFEGLPIEPPHNAVVVGLAKEGFSYANMNAVCCCGGVVVCIITLLQTQTHKTYHVHHTPLSVYICTHLSHTIQTFQ